MNTQTKQVKSLATDLDPIAELVAMPLDRAIELLSSAGPCLTDQCDMENSVTAGAHTRHAIPDDFMDAQGALSGWMDTANEAVKHSTPAQLAVQRRRYAMRCTAR